MVRSPGTVRPPGDSGDRIRLGSMEAAPGEAVQVPVYLTLSRPIEAYQLLVRHDPALFLPTLDQLLLEADALGGSEAHMNLVARSEPPGEVAAVVVLNPQRRGIQPLAREVIAGWLVGVVTADAPVGAEAPLELVALGAGGGERIDRRRTEIVAQEDRATRSYRPALEGGTLRVVSPDEAMFLRGDANFDLEVNITDAVFTLAHLFQGGAAPACADAADADDSGAIELTDALVTLHHLFGTGPGELAPPHPGRGRDARADDLPACREPGR